MEIGEKKLKDMDDLGTVLKMKMTEREKQKREINQIGLNRQKESELVKTLDTLERVKDRKMNPSEIAERMSSPGSFRRITPEPGYAKVKRKGKKVVLQEPE